MPSDDIARQHTILGVSVAFTTLSVLIIGLRLYTRAFVVRNLGKDDFAIIAGLIFQLGYWTCIIILYFNDIGYSGKYLSISQIVRYIHTILAIEVLYYLVVNSVKISILFFYLRISDITINDWTAKLCRWTVVFLAAFCGVCILVVPVQCIPLHKLWDTTGTVKGHCINTTAFFYFTSSFNIVIDVWILVLPIGFLRRMQRPKREMTALVCIFAIGGLSCIASIVRLYTIRIFTKSSDPTRDSTLINIFSMIETNLGIYCACLPALKALFIRARRQNNGHQLKSVERGEVASIKAFPLSSESGGLDDL